MLSQKISRQLLKSYFWKQFRFSLGNIPSIPIGAATLYLFLFDLHLPYIAAYILVFAFTTSINMGFQILLGVVKFEK